MKELQVEDICRVDGYDGWVLTGVDADDRSWHVPLAREAGEQVAAVHQEVLDAGGAITVEVDPDALIPAEEHRPCPLCGTADQWVVPMIFASLVLTTCDGCGQELSGSSLTPEMSEMAGKLLDVAEAHGS